MTYAGSSPLAISSDAKVWRSECDVIPSGSATARAAAAPHPRGRLPSRARASARRCPRRATGRTREHEVVGAGTLRGVPMRLELLEQDPEHVDRPHARVRVGRRNPEPAAREVDVAPAQRECLVDPRTSEHEHAQQDPAVRPRPSSSPAPRMRASIWSAVSRWTRGGREAFTLRLRPRAGFDGIRPYSTASSWICASRAIVLFDLRPPESRSAVGRFLGHLPAAVAVDLLDGDLRQAMTREHGQEVILERPPVVRHGAGPQLGGPGRDPAGRLSGCDVEPR
jgi:hypothetical protein